jgi:predicted aspartyl protease
LYSQSIRCNVISKKLINELKVPKVITQSRVKQADGSISNKIVERAIVEIDNYKYEGSGIAQWLYVAVTQGPERRFKFSEG